MPFTYYLMFFSLNIRGELSYVLSGFSFGILRVTITLLILLFFYEVSDHSPELIHLFLL